MKLLKATTSFLLLILAFCFAGTAKATDLTGTTIYGALTTVSDPAFSVTTPFAASAVVGPEVEFSGDFTVTDSLGTQDYHVIADFGPDTLFVQVTSDHLNFSEDGGNIFNLTFSNFPAGDVGFNQHTYLCSPSKGLCETNGDAFDAETFPNDGSAKFSFFAANSGDSYLFYNAAVTNPNPGTSPVPEPSTLAFLGTGMLGAAGGLRRRFACRSKALQSRL